MTAGLETGISADLVDCDETALRASKHPLRRFIDGLSARVFANRWTVSLTLAVTALSCALLAWSVMQRAMLVDLVDRLQAESQRLEQRLSGLQHELLGHDAGATQNALAMESARVFDDLGAVVVWIEQLRMEAQQLGLEVGYEVGGAAPSGVEGIAEVSVTLDIRQQGERADSVFRAATELTAQLLSVPWHLNVASGEARGAGAGLDNLRYELVLWVFDRDGFALEHAPLPGLDEDNEWAEMEAAEDEEFVQ